MSNTNDTEYVDLQRRLIEAVENIVRGSEFAPPSEQAAVVTDCVIVLGWANGGGVYGETHIRCGSPWATEALVLRAARQIEEMDDSPSAVEDE